MAENENRLLNTKQALNSWLTMTDMEKVTWVLGMNAMEKKERMYITQTIYIDKIMRRFNKKDSKMTKVPLSKSAVQTVDPSIKRQTPRQIPISPVSRLLTLLDCMNPDWYISGYNGVISFLPFPHAVHCSAQKGVENYLKKYKWHGLFYKQFDPSNAFIYL